MNRETTKADLLYYLRDRKVPVVALKGLWGTGKTHLWDEVRTEFEPIDDNDHLYASCFGLESVDQIKAALFQNSLGKAEKVASTAQKLSGLAIDVVEKVAAKFIPGAEGTATVVGSLGGLVHSVLIDKILQSRLIVLDDLERRGEGLRVDALLGFIDLLKRNDCKVLIILNEEPLAETLAADWRTLKEKCLDREITLVTEPGDAARIGLGDSLVYRDAVVNTLIRLSVTNIRVVQRIDRVVKTIFDSVSNQHGDVAQSMVPAAVLLTALNFNAVPGGPDVQDLMNQWSAWCAQPSFFADSAKEMSDAVAFALNAHLTRDIEFLKLVWRHLLTGHRFEEEFDALFETRRQHAEDNEAQSLAVRYIEDTYLDPSMQNQDFIERARVQCAAWGGVSGDKISTIALDLERRGDPKLALEIASEWARRWKAAPHLWISSLYPIDSLHPIIKEAVEEGNRQFSARPSLLEAVRQVSTRSWNPEDTEAINNASEQEMEDTILALGRDDFGNFIYFFRKENKDPLHSVGTGPIFSAGTETFLRVVRRLAVEKPGSRLAELLRTHLGDALLSPRAAAAGGQEGPAAKSG